MSRWISVAVVGMAIALAGCGSDDTTASLAEVDPLAARPIAEVSAIGTSVADISLPNVANNGQPFFMQAGDGEILVVYFGFTACPDICPTTLADVKKMLSILEDDAEQVTVAMVTIDPERDTDETMEAYLRSFVPDGVPLRTGFPDELAAVVDAFDADFDVIKSADGDVDVFHTAYLYAVDDTGVIRIIWPFGAEPEQIASDLVDLLAQ
ncbi:MAG: SCO family protein [Acidimicrobiia bacterium]